MLNLLIVCGTRPAIIKLAPLYHHLKSLPWASVSWLHTGQHDDMARQMLDCFGVEPDITFERRGQSLFDFSQGCRAQLEVVMTSRRWDLTIVQGDTEDAFLGALAGFYHRVPVAHVEAGLRTGCLERPFPEEGLRQMIARVTRFHFPPTERARAALEAEQPPSRDWLVSGNTVVDAQRWAMERHGIARRVQGRGHLLVTLHRREHWGGELVDACRAIADLARRHPELDVLFPVHRNPVVRDVVGVELGGLDNVRLSEPLDYVAMQQALADAWLVLTDSGGLQEEAPTHGVPLLVLRTETERPEAVEAGCARLLGTCRGAIVAEVERLWLDDAAHAAMSRAGNPFGDGRACERIAAHLQRALCPEAAR